MLLRANDILVVLDGRDVLANAFAKDTFETTVRAMVGSTTTDSALRVVRSHCMDAGCVCVRPCGVCCHDWCCILRCLRGGAYIVRAGTRSVCVCVCGVAWRACVRVYFRPASAGRYSKWLGVRSTHILGCVPRPPNTCVCVQIGGSVADQGLRRQCGRCLPCWRDVAAWRACESVVTLPGIVCVRACVMLRYFRRKFHVAWLHSGRTTLIISSRMGPGRIGPVQVRQPTQPASHGTTAPTSCRGWQGRAHVLLEARPRRI